MFPNVIRATTTSASVTGLDVTLDFSVLPVSSPNAARDGLALIRTTFPNGQHDGGHRAGLRGITV
jgi:hypothetical protein